MTLSEFLANNKNMPVYHGSDVLVEIPRIMQPVRALDFAGEFNLWT
jgi:hypothetical protein